MSLWNTWGLCEDQIVIIGWVWSERNETVIDLKWNIAYQDYTARMDAAKKAAWIREYYWSKNLKPDSDAVIEDSSKKVLWIFSNPSKWDWCTWDELEISDFFREGTCNEKKEGGSSINIFPSVPH